MPALPVSSDPQAGDNDDGPYEPPELEVVEFTRELDLHAFAPRQVGELVDDYLEHARAEGWPEVRVIHGKGTGVLRTRVHARLAKSPHVARFALADERRGSWGATVVWLHPPA